MYNGNLEIFTYIDLSFVFGQGGGLIRCVCVCVCVCVCMCVCVCVCVYLSSALLWSKVTLGHVKHSLFGLFGPKSERALSALKTFRWEQFIYHHVHCSNGKW
jgi:hypothetical protein